jgi:serine/threonine protein kinase
MVKLNVVKERMLYLSPTVQAGWEDESNMENFEISKNLGNGAFGKVFRVTHKSSKLVYAIKQISKSHII